ncbi:hypothetical protein N0V93_008209 [Gnomoniopsis smithogilvyi]|uniref:Carbohydrate esterase family 16 protein n=1 Tax=Gnomoniopsis smithogilvyi TaxID=1191159 RepID=A0A9W8YMI2_9PEZI|nr:hypothetical protein N0V93_008209 [Gnomoniopsis smithogilvyi]
MVFAYLAISHLAVGFAAAAVGINGFTNLFTFGDSYTSIDFQVSGAQPNASNPIGNPALPGVDTDNGYNWVGYLVTTYNDSLVLAYDFAVAGATVDSDIVPQYESSVRDFVQQVTEFQNHYSDSDIWNSSNSLFTSWFGINDIINGYAPANWSITANETVTQYFEEVQLLYDAGARNFVVFMVPPFWRAPKYLATNATTQEVQDTEKTLIGDLNDRYLARLAEFEEDNVDASVWTLNTTTVFDLALDNPTAYGSPDATCYDGDGTSCLWWNDLHPGQAIQNLVAQAVKNITSS